MSERQILNKAGQKFSRKFRQSCKKRKTLSKVRRLQSLISILRGMAGTESRFAHRRCSELQKNLVSKLLTKNYQLSV